MDGISFSTDGGSEVVATWGWDEPALAQILSADSLLAYVGLIASKTKWRVIRKALLARNIPEQHLDHVRAPAGLDLGAKTHLNGYGSFHTEEQNAHRN